MHRNGIILLLVLICVAFFVSCGKKDSTETEKGELVRTEAEGCFPSAFLYMKNARYSVRGIFYYIGRFPDILQESLTIGQRLGIIIALCLDDI